MLPITVSFFAKQKGPALPRTLVYGSGWLFTIVVIGLIFASALDVMARTSWFNLAIGLVFIVLAVSLFGLALFFFFIIMNRFFISLSFPRRIFSTVGGPVGSGDGGSDDKGGDDGDVDGDGGR